MAVLAALAAGACGGSDSPAGGAHPPDGAELYGRYCASCHGAEGDGQGPAAYLLFPAPRNFRSGAFKLRSTPQGTLPTDGDLVRTVTEGMPGTAMFAFGDLLSEAEIRAVVGHVKSLTPAFATAEPIGEEDLLAVPPPPPPTPELIAAGREVYEAFRCAQCHGAGGRGDGPSAPRLRDSEGVPFPAADFTYGIYKSGGRPEHLYRTFLTGMSGTPMPSFASALESEEQAWALVYYVLSLSSARGRPPTRSEPGPLAVAELAEADALEDPWAEGWHTAEPHRVVLRPLWYRNDYPPVVTVRAGRADGRIAFLLEWEDDDLDAGALRTEEFADAVALQFALSRRPPFAGMGLSDREGRVEIWHWRADRQAAAEAGRPAGLGDAYPRAVVDRVPFSAPAASVPTSTPGGGGPPGEQMAPFVSGRDVDNPLSTPALMVRPVHSLVAAGFGSLTAVPADRMRASGRGGWRDGVHRVVLNGPLHPLRPGLEVDFSSGRVPMAVAIWDGAAGDRNGTKLVSQWLSVALAGEAPQPREEEADEL